MRSTDVTSPMQTSSASSSSWTSCTLYASS